MQESRLKRLFNHLYSASTEGEVDKVVQSMSDEFCNCSWHPLGQNDNNYSIIENQQANSIAALIEKITNSIDAVLTKKCLEKGIDPKSKDAPQSMAEAREKFFPEHKNWDLTENRNQQAESIQILADGEKKDTSLIIYDDGEGQHPRDFEKTFLSLVCGNKNEIQFVQGKYNMGGSGAIVFCGKKRYQLIASKKYDSTGKFGFTLIRKHPMTTEEEKRKKNTWYEYLKIGDAIPELEIDSLNLQSRNREFTTGTIIKLYSYTLKGVSDISRDLNASINEYLFEPVLPVYTIESKKRYPNSSLVRGLYGLKRKLEKRGDNVEESNEEEDGNKYVEENFSLELSDSTIGETKITCYVFKAKIEGKTAKDSKDSIRREFFKNNMSVLFSINGQVHGNLTSEFITKSLKTNILKDYLLIHVNCTGMKRDFREELFMASRDRLKGSDETKKLREFLQIKLKEHGRLKEISEQRKASIALGNEDNEELIGSFTSNLPWNEELAKLCNQVMKSGKSKVDKDITPPIKKKRQEDEQPFSPQRFPAHFKLRRGGNTDVVSVPQGGKKTIYFDTDVENNYFDRIEEPGNMAVGLLDFNSNDTDSNCTIGKAEKIADAFSITKSSPQDGKIKLHLSPNKELNIGDEAKIKVSLSSPNAPEGTFDETFLVKISKATAPPQKTQKKTKISSANLKLPPLVKVYEKSYDDQKVTCWSDLGSTGKNMDHNTVVRLLVDNDKLDEIYINMDSSVFKNFNHKDKNPSEEKLKINEQNYTMTVYYHALFMFTITKQEKVMMSKDGESGSVEIEDYIENLFSNHYVEFLLGLNEEKIRQFSEY
ncbi:MAG: ATP-binding protein [Pseudomonadota bacterium]|nr:ATP-binding protein [Pseudomonadota bacterium]